MFAWLKRLTPRGIYGRAALILIVPIFTIQLVVSLAFIQRHFEDVTRQMTRNIVLEISAVLKAAEGEAGLVGAVRAMSGPADDLLLEVTAGDPTGREADPRAFYDLSGKVVIETLRAAFPETLSVDLSENRRVALTVATGQGPVRIAFDRRRVSATNPHQLLVLMVATGLLMTLIAFGFLRNQMRPIRQLARAAEAFGKGRNVYLKPAGAAEVRAAANAFLDMRNRIERQIEQRTLLLSGVSHDLRTPLTRLKLGLSLLPDDPDVRALSGDISDMERMLDAFLDFAQGDAQDGEAEDVDPARLTAKVVEDARRAGQAVTLTAVTGSGRAKLRPVAIERAIANLIGNAVRYGGSAEVSVALLDRALRVTVEDPGPGIPKDRRDEAMRPFTRLDAARNQDRGPGVGLGLAITADIARSHGGTLRLSDSERLGGLKAELILAR
jgi:two-component system, OmpR family, osmolarity sensor histidine kinase EnvZ